jgi:hypothetical protein
MTRTTLFSMVILLLAAAFRLHAVAYGLQDVCLTVPDEYWLFADDPSVSLYHWNLSPRGALETLPGRAPSAPLVTADSPGAARLFVRLIGTAAGLLTIAFVIRLGRGLRTLVVVGGAVPRRFALVRRGGSLVGAI